MDDPKRAIVAAQLLVDRIAAIGRGVSCSVGIASGLCDVSACVP
jgi:hypothetical protein